MLYYSRYLIVVSMVFFWLFGFLSAVLYEGGNNFSEQASYNFWLNYFCDSVRGAGYNGASSGAAGVWGAIAMLVLVIGCLLPTQCKVQSIRLSHGYLHHKNWCCLFLWRGC